MSGLRPPLAPLLIALHSAACGAATFACEDDARCGDGGRCEPNGYCSFADLACASGRRFGEHAPAGIAGACVDGDVGTGDVSSGGGSSSSTGNASTGDSSSTAASTSVASTGEVTSTGDGGSSSSDSTDGGPTPVEVGPIAIATDLDDGAMWPTVMGEVGTWSPSGEVALGQAYLGEYPEGEPYWGYFRFQLPRALPAGTVVQGAVLTIDGHGTYQWDEQVHALRVWAERSDDAPQVEGLASLPGGDLVALTEASARWPATGGLAWSTDGSNASPDLAPLLQELVDDGGLVAGASVQLWVAADDLATQGHEVGWIDASGLDDREARLNLSLLLP
ncbi:MAG: hypothetical protein IPK74_26895 [Deltaproteobacteria bacterium]|nr:hypothetical protein [Deltaproteobacteria bacterium]